MKAGGKAMRHGLIALLVAFALGTLAAAAGSGSAPADEYFGPRRISILEIRNRLDRLDAYGDRSPLAWSVVASLDSLERSIVDWQRKYPRDPWLPRSLAHLLHEYWRAGALATAGARETVQII